MSMRRAALLAVVGLGLCLALPAGASEHWTSYHNACNQTVLGTQQAVLTGIHYFIGEKHFMFVYEWCMAGNPPAYHLEVSRQWPGMPGMMRQVTEPYQV